MAYEEGGVTMCKKSVDYLEVVDPYEDEQEPGTIGRFILYVLALIIALYDMVVDYVKR
jgi:hypothetical protein